jgi:hypothetical protein
MSDPQTQITQTVTNPFQASASIFYNPKSVFDALFLRDNWSWVPFFMLCIVLFMPAFLFFKVVDFDYWVKIFAQIQLPDGSPREQQNLAAGLFATQMQYSLAILSIVGSLILNLILAGYYTMMTKNDEKSIHGFSDWFGAMWWCMMPALLAGLIAIGLVSLYEQNVQTYDAVLTPLSLTFLFAINPTSPWYEALKMIRIDAIWSVYLGYVLLKSWTAFSSTKAIVVASAPYIAVVAMYLVYIIVG